MPARPEITARCTCNTDPSPQREGVKYNESCGHSASKVCSSDGRGAHKVQLSRPAVCVPAAQVVKLRDQEVVPPKHRVKVKGLLLCWLRYTAPV